MKLLKKARPVVAVTAILGLAWPVTTFAATNYVAFGNFFFRPSDLTIHAGDTVIWTNAGGTHTVTGMAGDTLCGPSAVNACTDTFTATGVFPYECLFHASFGMTGVVRVVGLPPSPAILTNAMWTNGDFVFRVLSAPSQTNIVQAATNLGGAANWVSLETNVPATNVFLFSDTNASLFRLRLYRVVQP